MRSTIDMAMKGWTHRARILLARVKTRPTIDSLAPHDPRVKQLSSDYRHRWTGH